jgi:hypothetical protein
MTKSNVLKILRAIAQAIIGLLAAMGATSAAEAAGISVIPAGII